MGSVVAFLQRADPPLTIDQLSLMCLEVAAGMKYLEQQKIVHRDLGEKFHRNFEWK
jgi:serine/threonine protein kinase